MLKAESTGQCGIITVSGQNLREHTRGNQQVLQLCYKKLTCYIIIYSVIFQHTLLQHRCIFSNHASTAIVSDSSSVNQIPQR